MANFHKSFNLFKVSLFIVLLVILLELVAAARPPPSKPVTTATHLNNMQRAPSARLIVRPHAPVLVGYRVNRYKKTETEAFRPTAPGRSPGAGHETPPGSH